MHALALSKSPVQFNTNNKSLNTNHTRFYEYKDKGGGLCPEVTKYIDRKLSQQYTLLICQNKVKYMEGLKIRKDI